MTHLTIIHGKMRSGKTLFAKRFREHYNRQHVIDCDFSSRHGMEQLQPDTLVLTTSSPDLIRKRLHFDRTIREMHADDPLTFHMVPIEDARKAIGVSPTPEAMAGGLIQLPVRHDTEYPGTIVDLHDRELLVIDPDNDRPDAEVTAIADAIVAAMNKAGTAL